jgi:hypothetical protein
MNRDPHFELLPDPSTPSVSHREKSVKEKVAWCFIAFVALLGIKSLRRWAVPGTVEIVDAAFLSVFLNFGVPAMLRYTEHRDSVLIHKTLPLP